MLSGAHAYGSGAKSIIQSQMLVVDTLETITGTIPLDTSIPQISEGVEIFADTFDKKESDSDVLFQMNVSLGGNPSTYVSQIFSFFINGASSASFAMYYNMILAESRMIKWQFAVSGETAPFTWSIRTGNSTSDTVYLNGLSTGKKLSTSQYSSVHIFELQTT